MHHDFDAIPDAVSQRDRVGSMLTRIYHDIGLAAVADALDLMTAEFEADLTEAIERGVYYLVPIVAPAAPMELAA